MRVPARFRLNSVPWTVHLVTLDELKKIAEDDDDDLQGYTVQRKLSIYLSDDLAPIPMYLAFLHELQHAYDFANGKQGGSERDADAYAHLRYDYEQTLEGDHLAPA